MHESAPTMDRVTQFHSYLDLMDAAKGTFFVMCSRALASSLETISRGLIKDGTLKNYDGTLRWNYSTPRSRGKDTYSMVVYAGDDPVFDMPGNGNKSFDYVPLSIEVFFKFSGANIDIVLKASAGSKTLGTAKTKGSKTASYIGMDLCAIWEKAVTGQIRYSKP